MAFGTASKIFSAFVTDAVNGTAPFDLNSDSLKVAIYNNTGTPDQTAAAASAAYNAGAWVVANEADNGGWSAGGLVLGSVTSGFASNVYTLDAADSANGAAATIADTRGCLIYDDTLTTPVADQGVCYLSFGGQQSVTAGTLTIQYNASGILTLTL
ncbi:MAG: hypothetical protein L0H84_00870 [Pseudonocardia sp.]|nr:hypothetical protein [Pseudonocardia sp.]